MSEWLHRGLSFVVVLICLTGCATTAENRGEGLTQSVTEGDVTVTYAAEAFDSGSPRIGSTDVSGSDFIDAFGLKTAAGQVATASITAESQPKNDVKIAFQLDPNSVPEGAIPAIFYFEPDSQLWLPIPSEYTDNGMLVGTASHFTDFAAAIASGLETAEEGAQWLRFQVARAVGARAGGVECSGGWPIWLLGVEVDDGLNAPMPTCAEADDDRLRVRIVNNRPYGLLIDAPVAPSEASYAGSLEPEDVVAAALASNDPLVFGEDVLLPAGMQADLYWERDALGSGDFVINGRANAVTVGLDSVYLGATEIASFVSLPVEVLSGVFSCVQGVSDTVSSSPEMLTGAFASSMADCLEPLAKAVDGAPTEVGKKVLAGLKAGLLLGRGAQTILDVEAALNEPHRVVLSVADVAPDPPGGGSLLHDIRVDWSGAGPSGEATDALLGSTQAHLSTTQWVGCGDEAAWAEYELSGQDTLTAVLGKQSFTPRSIRAQVRVIVDGTVIKEYEVADQPVDVDVRLPQGGQVLKLSAIATAGTCGGASEGYLAWGNGAVSAGQEEGRDVTAGQRYTNPRFGFSVDVPEGFVKEEPGPANGDGAHFKDGQASVGASGENNVWSKDWPGLDTPATPSSEFRRAIRGRRETITYKALLKDGYAISGTDKSGMVFYIRKWVGDGSMNTLWWSYPKDAGLDDAVSQTVASFSPGDLTESH